MATFRYEALDENGHTRKGVMEADGARQVREQLRELGLTPLAVSDTQSDTTDDGRRKGVRWRMSLAERTLVLRQMASLSGAGLPLEDILGTVAEQSGQGTTQSVMTSLRTQVREGRDLAAAMRDFPRAFPEEIAAAVEAGEHSGSLDRVLMRLADFAERRQGLGREIGLAMLYPLIVAGVALLVIAALMTWVVPRVVRVFEHAERELPMLTRMMISISEILTKHGWWLALLLAVVVAVLVRSWRHPRVRGAWQSVFLRVPLLGRALKAGATARFCRSLSLQVTSGVPLVEALRISAAAPGLLPMCEAIESAAREVREGATLSDSLQRRNLFPPLALRLVASGEQSGRLGELLDHAAESQEREATMLARSFSAILQPLLILVVGLFVLLITLAVMLPILNLNQLLT